MLYNILTILLALAMALTFFGKAVIGVTLGLCVILSCAIIVQNRHGIFYDQGRFKLSMLSKEKLAILLMLGLWIVSAINGVKPDKSIKEVLEYGGIILGGLIIFTALNAHHFSFEKLFRWLVIVAAVCATYLVLTPLIDDWAQDWGSSYGAVLTIIMPFALYQTFRKPRQLKYWLCLFLITVAIFASGSRTAWVALMTVVILFPFLNVWHQTGRRFLKLGLIGAMVFMSAFFGMQINKHVIGEDYFESRKEAMITMERPASGRLTVWANTIDMIEQRPWLGYGIKSSQSLKIEKSESYYVLHVHNAVLELILETGLLGFLAIAIVIVIFVGHFLRAYLKSTDIKVRQQAMAIFLACIAYGVCSMALTSMFHAWWFLYLVVLLILLKTAELRLKQNPCN